MLKAVVQGADNYSLCEIHVAAYLDWTYDGVVQAYA
jgi:hypothetical protein